MNLLKIIFFIIFTSWISVLLLPTIGPETLVMTPPTLKHNILINIAARQHLPTSLIISFPLGVITLLLFIITSYLRRKYKKIINYWTLRE